MDRSGAIDRINKLFTITTERGASLAEQDTARRRAAALAARFNVRGEELADLILAAEPPPAQPPKSSGRFRREPGDTEPPPRHFDGYA